MDVLLNDEETLVVDSAREFLNGECPTSLVRAMETDPVGYPKELWGKVAELGWQGMCLPERVGGSDMPMVYLGLVLREAGRALAPLPLHSTAVASLTIARDGTEAQQQKYLPDVVAGKSVLTWAFIERDPRYVPAAVQMSTSRRTRCGVTAASCMATIAPSEVPQNEADSMPRSSSRWIASPASSAIVYGPGGTGELP